MRKIEVIRASERDRMELWTDEIRIREIPYKGFSRGFGEFMAKTVDDIEPCQWVCWLPADIKVDIKDIIEASKTAPSEFWALSLSKDSFVSHAWTRVAGAGWREVPFVDLAPVYSYSFVLRAKEYFGESKSGWGLDLIFADLNRKRNGFTAHVCDDYQMKHTKKLESQNWVIDGKTPMDELQQIKTKFRL